MLKLRRKKAETCKSSSPFMKATLLWKNEAEKNGWDITFDFDCVSYNIFPLFPGSVLRWSWILAWILIAMAYSRKWFSRFQKFSTIQGITFPESELEYNTKVKISNERGSQQHLLEFSSTGGQYSGSQRAEQVSSGFFFSVATARSQVYGCTNRTKRHSDAQKFATLILCVWPVVSLYIR